MSKKHFFNLPDGFALLNDPTYRLLIQCEWRGKIRQHGFPRKGKSAQVNTSIKPASNKHIIP